MQEANFEQRMLHLFQKYDKSFSEEEILNLLDGARTGSEEAKLDIIYYISQSIFQTANSTLISRNITTIDVWDLYQAGIVAVVKTAIPNYKPGEATFKTYATNCAKFKIKDEISKILDAGIVERPRISDENNSIQSVEKMMEDAGELAQKEISDAYEEHEYVKNPETIVFAEIESEIIKELIEQLTTEERKVVNMHIYQGEKSFKQIADELDLFDFEVEDIYRTAVNKLTNLISK